MMHRTIRLTWLTIVLGLTAPPLVAERNLIPSLESIPDVCSERPNEPNWMENIALVRTVQTCCKPRTSTTAAQMNFGLKPKRSAKPQAIGRDILK